MEEVKNIEENKAILYEISFIQETEEEGVSKSIIEKRGGSVLEDRPLIKIRFAYPIAKHAQGFLSVMKFTAEPDCITLIDADLRLEKKVLRHMISRFIPNDEESGGDTSEDGRARRGRFVRGEKKTTGYEPALSNEALEKKIEEILQ